MILFDDIIEHLETKPKAVYMNNRPHVDDNFKFYEIGIQQTFPKYPKRFLNIFQEEDKNIFGIYFRHRIGQEEELYEKYNWVTKSEVKGYSIATFNQETLLEDVKDLIDHSYKIVLETLTKAEQKAVNDLASEKNHFFLFDKLAYKFKDASKYIFADYSRETEITKAAKCVIRFENNMVFDMSSGELSKDYRNWEAIIRNAINSNS